MRSSAPTASRRKILLLEARPDLVIKSIRGNVDTRLRKLHDEAEGYDAIVLAAAGLARVGMTGVITEFLDPVDFYTRYRAGDTGGAGARGIATMCWHAQELSSMQPTRVAADAEQAFSRTDRRRMQDTDRMLCADGERNYFDGRIHAERERYENSEAIGERVRSIPHERLPKIWRTHCCNEAEENLRSKENLSSPRERASAGSAEWRKYFKDLGAKIYSFPTITIVPQKPDRRTLTIVKRIRRF